MYNKRKEFENTDAKIEKKGKERKDKGSISDKIR